MTGKELLQHQFADAGYQLDKCFEGIESLLDAKISDSGMSPRGTATHLAECYFALSKEAAGEKHEWGTFKPNATEWPALWIEAKELRAKALDDAMAKDGLEKSISSFLAAHDYYHVGQLVAVRLANDPSWDAYSIYNW